MPRSWLLAALAACVTVGLVAVPSPQPVTAAAPQDDAKKKFKKDVEASIEKGLEYLKKIQAQDGHWEAQGGQYPTSMTALAGMAFLMEGSTLKEGKYSDQVKKAVDWFLAPARQQPNGMIGDVRNPTEQTRYMYGQGFGTMFLASVYGEEEDKEQREKLEKLLKKAVEFICKAQTLKKHRKAEGKEVDIGGWGYVSAAEGNNFDEGSVTITALQGLRAARNAGIPVPKENIDRAVNYLEACTTPKGGIIYSYAGGGGAVGENGRPPLTAAAVCCGFSAGQYKSELPKRWIKYCKDNIPVGKGRQSHDEYQTYYFSQAVYALGDDKYLEMFPLLKADGKTPKVYGDLTAGEKDQLLTWSGYKDATFQTILDNQDKTNGSWSQGYIGPVYTTSINLCILQLEKAILPIYQK
ncbi:prenyltransferase/squalene oxidase repeat-containing protein [Gemmata sp. JC717]|uniref:Terpene cyclase/mutase family protein n=1 Tax=Gemmata algarum TaxID=2975278 RepID=A0ABU5ET64_9BACT|nr:prenyltransferase/squalene oxidase repeat-containing protein [Gemmata algarum]MDY3552116.1 prenyltransferase/squalene oxidase repeat-containing protein [Gemmata algarum]MDY3558350.1 terpene cyclase/mutase family protein [Gemmata algarum]